MSDQGGVQGWTDLFQQGLMTKKQFESGLKGFGYRAEWDPSGNLLALNKHEGMDLGFSVGSLMPLVLFFAFIVIGALIITGYGLGNGDATAEILIQEVPTEAAAVDVGRSLVVGPAQLWQYAVTALLGFLLVWDLMQKGAKAWRERERDDALKLVALLSVIVGIWIMIATDSGTLKFLGPEGSRGTITLIIFILLCVIAGLASRDVGVAARPIAMIAMFYAITPDKSRGVMDEVVGWQSNAWIHNLDDFFRLIQLKVGGWELTAFFYVVLFGVGILMCIDAVVTSKGTSGNVTDGIVCILGGLAGGALLWYLHEFNVWAGVCAALAMFLFVAYKKGKLLDEAVSIALILVTFFKMALATPMVPF